jgi:hypothetical protein
MIPTIPLTLSQEKYFDELVVKVILWAIQNVPDEYTLSSRVTFWNSALDAGVITQNEYEFVKTQYCNQVPNMWNQTMWNYVPDQEEGISND